MTYLIALTLNAVDGIATAVGMRIGVLAEANPLLAGFGPVTILLIKIVPISGFIVFLFRHRTRRLSRFGIVAVCAVYVYIFILHVGWIVAVMGD